MQHLSQRAVLGAALLAFAATMAGPARAEAPQRVLFVGNSYTFFGTPDLPASYAALVAAGFGGAWGAETQSATAPGYTLAQHAADLAAGAAIAGALGAGGGWDYVVLQDQSQVPAFPTAQPEWQASLQGGLTLASAARGAGAEPVFFMTWGRRDGDPLNPARFPTFGAMQAHLAAGYEAYADAASSPGALAWIAPVGLAFAAVREVLLAEGLDPDAEGSRFRRLYAGDGSHPSQLGTALAASVFHAALTGREPGPALVDAWVPAVLDAEDAAAIAEAAWRAVRRYGVEARLLPWGAASYVPVVRRWADVAEDGSAAVAGAPERPWLVVDGGVDGDVATLGGAMTDGLLLVDAGGAEVTLGTVALEGPGSGVIVTGGVVTVGAIEAASSAEVVLEGGVLTLSTLDGSLVQRGGELRVPTGGTAVLGSYEAHDAILRVGAAGAGLDVAGAVHLGGALVVDGEAARGEVVAVRGASVTVGELALTGPEGAAWTVEPAGDTVALVVRWGEPPPEPGPDAGPAPDRGAPDAAAGAVEAGSPSPAGSGGCAGGPVGGLPAWLSLLSLLAAARKPGRARDRVRGRRAGPGRGGRDAWDERPRVGVGAARLDGQG